MELAVELLGEHGLLAVFIVVLLNQGGLPIPAWPVLILAAALAFRGGEPLWPIMLAGLVAAVIADLAWFAAGRRLGERMVGVVCRVASRPDTEAIGAREAYDKWGAPALLVAKFVPGLAAIATTMAGHMRVRTRVFVLFDGIGAGLWLAVPILLGAHFHGAVAETIAQLANLGRQGLLLLALPAGAFLAYLAWQRRHALLRLRPASCLQE